MKLIVINPSGRHCFIGHLNHSGIVIEPITKVAGPQQFDLPENLIPYFTRAVSTMMPQAEVLTGEEAENWLALQASAAVPVAVIEPLQVTEPVIDIVPPAADIVPAAADITPVVAEIVPAAADIAPVVADIVPAVADIAPAAAEAPKAEEQAPAAAETSSKSAKKSTRQKQE